MPFPHPPVVTAIPRKPSEDCCMPRLGNPEHHSWWPTVCLSRHESHLRTALEGASWSRNLLSKNLQQMMREAMLRRQSSLQMSSSLQTST